MFNHKFKTSLSLFAWIFAFTAGDTSVCSKYLGSSPPAGNFSDNALVGSVIYSFNQGLINATITIHSDCKDAKYINMNGTDVILMKYVLTICKLAIIACDVSCSDGSPQPIPSTLRIIRKNTDMKPPEFKEQKYNTTVKESKPIGTIIYDMKDKVQYNDCFSSQDSPIFQLQDDADGTFEIGIGGDVKLKSTVNYESEHKMYTLNVSVEHRPARIAYTLLDVYVEDVDDMDPVFSNDTFILVFKEENNSNINSWLNTTPPVHAEDRDEGKGKQNITYTIKEHTDLFDIDPQNGQIKVKQTLDREKKSQYTFVLQAVQTNDPIRSATANLIINVEDINDNLPKFVLKPNHVQINEHSSVGTYVTQVSAKDEDEGKYAEVLYTLGNNGDIFDIDNVTGVIHVRNSNLLDREKHDELILTIFAIDVHENKTGDEINVNVTLLDINDNTPTFPINGYLFYLNESSINMEIGQVTATDDDYGDNGNVTYEIIPLSDFRSFSIDQFSGKITLKSIIEGTAILPVQACDNPVISSTQRCSQVIVEVVTHGNVTISSLNDQATVQENSIIGTIVTQMKVTGSRYIVEPNDTFSVDKRGLVLTKMVLDREETEIYNVGITVFGIGNRIIANVSLEIEVIDVNDNTPKFTESSYVFILPENIQSNGMDASVEATDRDSKGNNSKIQFFLKDTVDAVYFAIDTDTGKLHLSNHDLPPRNSFQLTVIATDLGDPSLSSIVTVYFSRIVAEGHTIKLGTPLNIDELHKRQKQLDRDIGDILNVTVMTESTDAAQSSHYTRSYMFISAKYKDNSMVPVEDLRRMVLRHMSEIEALFSAQSIFMSVQDRKFGGAEIALIVIAATLLIGTIVAIVILRYKWNTKERYDRLNETLTRRSSLYESQEIKIKLEEETSDYTGSLNTNELENGNGNSNYQSGITAFENPVYTDNETHVKVSASTAEAINEAISSLDHAYQNEEEMESNRPKPDYESTDIDFSLYDPVPDYNANECKDGDNQEESNIPEPQEPAKTYENVNFDQDQLNDNLAPLVNNYENIELLGQESDPGVNHNDVIAFPTVAEQNKENGEHEYAAHIDDNADVGGDEPQPDYNLKQVRFSGEVLDTDENKIEPLKEEMSKQQTNGDESDTSSSNGDNVPPTIMIDSDDNDETLFKLPIDHMDESDRVDEEINSPTNFLKPETSDNTSGTFNFGVDEDQIEITAF